jgi:hypothetical protein
VTTCVRGVPTISMTPTQTQWAAPGTAASWTVSVKNNDSSGCSTGNLAMGAGLPAGWSATFSSQYLALAPGATGSATMGVTSPSSAANGFYTVQSAVDAGTGVAVPTASATYAVLGSYNVAVTASMVTTRKQSSLSAVARVSANGAGVAGVPVTFTVTKADGKQVTASATTNSAGDASYSLKPGPKDAKGTWTVAAVASLNGITGSGSTTVVVP